MKKINVLFLMPHMAMGGSERLVHTLASNLDRTVFAPHVGWFNGAEALKEFKDLNVPLFNLRKAEGFDLKTMTRLSGIIRDHSIDIVNAQHFMPAIYSFYGCRIARKRPLIYTLHSEWELDRVPPRWAGLGRLLFSDIDVVSVNEGASAAVIRKFGLRAEKVRVISNGVDLKKFAPGRQKTEAASPLAGLAGAKFKIGMVANFKTVKNHLFLLKAFNELAKELPGAKLILPGQGFKNDTEGTEGEIRRFIKENRLEKDVLLPGYMEDVSEALGALDVFCLTSHKEGLPISLIEAMASGLPVIGADVQGIKNIIRNGENGFLIKEGDVSALKEALARVLKDAKLRKSMGAKSRELAWKEYSMENCMERYQGFFNSLSNKGNH